MLSRHRLEQSRWKRLMKELYFGWKNPDSQYHPKGLGRDKTNRILSGKSRRGGEDHLLEVTLDPDPVEVGRLCGYVQWFP